MAIAEADRLEESAPTPPPPRRPSRLRAAAVPGAAVLTVVVLALLQGWAVAAWAESDGESLRDVLGKWDAGWMTQIAEFGYSGFSVSPDPAERVEWQSVAFFPAFPVVVRIVSSPLAVFGVEDATFLGGLMVSAVASLVLAWGVACLALELWQRSRPAAARLLPQPTVRTRVAVSVAAAVLAFGAPMSFLYWMPFTEALFGALAVWALVMMLRQRYLAASLLTLGAGLTRITAIALVLTLCVAAVAELWQWSRRRTRFPLAALLAPAIGYAGTALYLAWADRQVADIGGYFAAQKRGWSSHVDLGAASWRWLREHPYPRDTSDHDAVAYALSSWSIVLVAVLCVVSLWPLLRRWLPWQVWLTAILIAGSVLGSDGIMHARPRLLLMPVLLLLLPFVVRAVQWALRERRGRALRSALVASAGAAWCVLGCWVFCWMLIEFQYGI